MKDTLASYKLSNLAKDLGFDEPCLYVYTTFGSVRHCLYYEGENDECDEGYNRNSYLPFYEEDAVTAPSLSLLQKWLRETHNIDIIVDTHGILHKKPEGYKVTVYSIKTVLFSWKTGGTHKSYEQALEAGLLTALEYIENENKL